VSADTFRAIASLFGVRLQAQPASARSIEWLGVVRIGVSGQPRVPMPDPSTAEARDPVSVGLTSLLSRLHPDPLRAAAEYERLRLSLERFFDWQGAWPPDECADETLDRLARKLTERPIDDVRAYARGIARLVLLEWKRRSRPVSLSAQPEEPASPSDERAENASATLVPCFERCLDALPVESRSLVLEYYGAERQTRIDNRRRLAQSRGLSESALRNRVQRVRDRIERCVHDCACDEPLAAVDPPRRRPGTRWADGE